tara:strand:+ start:680 stop:814 length:135 start_codon:yes stop_codon:yes gene_type:complete
MKEKLIHLYGGDKKENPSTSFVIKQAEEGKSIAMFPKPEARPLI